MPRKIAYSALFAVVVTALGAYALSGAGGTSARVVHNYEIGVYTYSGGTEDGIPGGTGELVFENGGYSGGFADDRFNGEGRLWHGDFVFDGTFQNGAVTSGVFTIGDEPPITYSRAENRLTARNWSYEGFFNDFGQRDEGTFTFADGSVYTGSFYQGYADGTGVYADANGVIIYEGEFLEGYIDGYGTYYSPEGWTYEGWFYENAFEGEGVIKSGDEVIRGFWEEGKQAERYD